MDLIAVSFVQSADDVHFVRKTLDAGGGKGEGACEGVGAREGGGVGEGVTSGGRGEGVISSLRLRSPAGDSAVFLHLCCNPCCL